MGSKVDTVTSRLNDSRNKRVVFISHCILNENVRYLGGAFRKSGVNEIIDQCIKKDIGIVQMPCPEQKAWGGVIKRWYLRALGDNRLMMRPVRLILFPLFLQHTKRIYRRLAHEVCREIEDYIVSGYEVIGIVGIDGSPSCGVNKTLDMYKILPLLATLALEKLDQEKMNTIIRSTLAEGAGLFTIELKNALARRKIKVKYLAHDLIREMDGLSSNVVLS